jgi:mono/diheme cytochrome c family protein
MKTISQALSRTGFALIMIGNTNLVFAQNIESGKAQYLQFCASCHGMAGKGDGPSAQLFNPPPADLTQLADKNGGLFPLVRVYDAIHGTAVKAHEGRDMPLPAIVGDPILRVIEYLITLQGNSIIRTLNRTTH